MVLVCYPHNFIFLKTAKTAGTSVEMFLEPLCLPPPPPENTQVVEHRPEVKTRYGIVGRRGQWPDPEGVWPLKYIRYRLEWRNHRSARFVRLRLGKKRWHQSTRITTIRNPFDKAVSRFHFKYRHKKIEGLDFSTLRAKFLEYMQYNYQDGDKPIVFLWGKYIIDGEIRFEHLREDLQTLQRDLALPIDPVANLPHEKSMKKSRKSYPVPDYYDRKSIEIVKSKLAWMFDRFDYPTEPVDT